jgi:glycine/serine hydroxymethyltransferase
VVDNAKALAATPEGAGLDIVSGGTDNHLMLVDLRPKKRDRQARRGRARPRLEMGITCNKNGIPFDPEKPFVTSGVRLGTPAAPRAASARRNSARSAPIGLATGAVIGAGIVAYRHVNKKKAQEKEK